MESANLLGKELARRGIELVYGGAQVGLMGEVANSVLESGGKVIGVIPKSFADKVSHENLTELYVVDSMHQRKNKMHKLSDGFIALPGGYGTLEEVAEILTWCQLGISNKPCGVININGYFNLLFEFLDNAVREGFMKTVHREMLRVSETPSVLIDELIGYEVPNVDKWVGVKLKT